MGGGISINQGGNTSGHVYYKRNTEKRHQFSFLKFVI